MISNYNNLWSGQPWEVNDSILHFECARFCLCSCDYIHCGEVFLGAIDFFRTHAVLIGDMIDCGRCSILGGNDFIHCSFVFLHLVLVVLAQHFASLFVRHLRVVYRPAIPCALKCNVRRLHFWITGGSVVLLYVCVVQKPKHFDSARRFSICKNEIGIVLGNTLIPQRLSRSDAFYAVLDNVCYDITMLLILLLSEKLGLSFSFHCTPCHCISCCRHHRFVGLRNNEVQSKNVAYAFWREISKCGGGGSKRIWTSSPIFEFVEISKGGGGASQRIWNVRAMCALSVFLFLSLAILASGDVWFSGSSSPGRPHRDDRVALIGWKQSCIRQKRRIRTKQPWQPLMNLLW